MKVQFAIFAKLLLLSNLVLATAQPQLVASKHPLDARATVNRFCDLDLAGVRLDSTNPDFPEFTKLIGDGDWPEEPVAIVSEFHILSSKQEGNQASAEVEYHLLGSIRGALESDEIVPQRTPEVVKFPLRRVRGRWKIKPFELPPHVGIVAMRSHVQQILDSDEKAGDLRRHEVLQRLLLKLGSLGT